MLAIQINTDWIWTGRVGDLVGSSSVKMKKIDQEEPKIVGLTFKIRARAYDQFILCESL